MPGGWRSWSNGRRRRWPRSEAGESKPSLPSGSTAVEQPSPGLPAAARVRCHRERRLAVRQGFVRLRQALSAGLHRVSEPSRRSSGESARAKEDGGEAGIRTLGRVLRPYNGLANRRLQPLGHLTADVSYVKSALALIRLFLAKYNGFSNRRLRQIRQKIGLISQ